MVLTLSQVFRYCHPVRRVSWSAELFICFFCRCPDGKASFAELQSHPPAR
jgi:hypothetical protein